MAKFITFVNPQENKAFRLNQDNVDMVWAYDEENKLYINMGSVQYIFKLVDGENASYACDIVAGTAAAKDIKIDGWWNDNNLGQLDVVKLN